MAKNPHDKAELAKKLCEQVRTHPVVPEKRFFKIPEAVAYSGQSRSTLYEAHKRGEIPFTKFGGATRIEKADLDSYLDHAGVRVVAGEPA